MCKNAKEYEGSSNLNDDNNMNDGIYNDSCSNNIKRHNNSLTNYEEDIFININMMYFFSLSLDEQIINLFRIKNVQSFQEIKKILKSNIEDEVLLNCVKKYCINILGLWVIKSKYLYKFLRGKTR